MLHSICSFVNLFICAFAYIDPSLSGLCSPVSPGAARADLDTGAGGKEYSPARNRGDQRALRVLISLRLPDRWNMQGVHGLEVTESPSRECDRENML